ncbi:mediator of RNA polymerase II transcription subunit 11 isoform X2 [Oncorhynchus kisutch]|uniref:mediator of RNA polymerase II transcription subunit 11 isoform X2 n=1 Tax=Oncorhynchus kisutch TaxID=8019 RepID=UPI0012DF99FD|nr:mediator of RNA polymerase II transcription subunit 11 isoform X2 [Oncorhynchus kisutch]
MANDRLRALEEVENQIATILQCAGNVVLELSKDKHNASFLDRQLSQFTGSVNRVETELSSQIRYLTQVTHADRHSCTFTGAVRVETELSSHRLPQASPTRAPRTRPGKTVKWP